MFILRSHLQTPTTCFLHLKHKVTLIYQEVHVLSNVMLQLTCSPRSR